MHEALVDQHGFRRWLLFCHYVRKNMLMCLPVERLHSLADSLVAKFKGVGGTVCIDEAINLDRRALTLCPPGHLNRFVSLISLAVDLGHCYSHFGVIGDLEEAIVLAHEGVDLCSVGHPGRPTCLNTLAAFLFTQYKQCGAIADLENAIVLSHEGLGLHPQGDPLWPYLLNNLACCLSTRFHLLGETNDLNETIALDHDCHWPVSTQYLSRRRLGSIGSFEQPCTSSHHLVWAARADR